MIEPDTIGYMLAEVFRMQRLVFEKRIAEAGLELTPGEARALLCINVMEGCRQNEIADKLGIEPMTMSGYIDKLEARALVERQPDPTDRRARSVVLTKRAEPELTAVLREAHGMVDDMMKGFSPAERELFRLNLKKVKANLDQLTSQRTA